jgi:hypothetical protein
VHGITLGLWVKRDARAKCIRTDCNKNMVDVIERCVTLTGETGDV